MQLIYPQQRLAAPEFNLPLLNSSMDSNKLTLSKYSGKIILLNFWATFCIPCRDEMPALQVLWDNYKQNDFVVLAITVDDINKQMIKNFSDNLQLTFPIAIDNKDIRKLYEINALPTSYIIGRDGKFIAKIIGSRDWASENSLLYFEKLLQQ
jgi:thiol-disulfide isomerase/thioredoxin